MKNMNNILGLLRTSALCLTLAVMAACDAEDFTRTAGDIPGKDDLANVGGVLRPIRFQHSNSAKSRRPQTPCSTN